jgi:uncharacterized protein YaaQ
MKLVLAIINNDDCVAVTSALTREKFIVTRLSTTGGFLLAGNTTLLVGAEDSDVDRVEAIIQEFSKARMSDPLTNENLGMGLAYNDLAPDVHVGGATVFVLNVERMSKY